MQKLSQILVNDATATINIVDESLYRFYAQFNVTDVYRRFEPLVV